MPHVEYIIMSLDAAAEKHNRADYTALTSWGVFLNKETDNHNIILLDSIKERLEFPELKQLAMDEYNRWEPDAFIVEKKSSGVAELVEEVAGFPFMSNDDLVDSTVMALLRFRQGGFIRLPSDMQEDDSYIRRKAAYY